ncbi:bone morphogenetic protein 1-like [Patiria miniata]|uniref:CUB domain-containing protein n=1 Tax=Patiria miniata TaxID=46514 RepID=A0A913ZQM7_PATMI|nr:bone morphogenetic protein 1-like [Patiria miniata]
MFQLLFNCCLLASFLFLTTANVGMIRHILKRQTDTCASELVARQHAQSFTSPGFPSDYPNNADCSWRMRTSPGNQIVVSFVSIDVEFERNCQYDYLIIYDGPDDTNPQIGRYCGRASPADFTSTSPHVFVKFRSDSSDTGGGFEIHFRGIGNFGGDGGEDLQGVDGQGGDLGGVGGGLGGGGSLGGGAGGGAGGADGGGADGGGVGGDGGGVDGDLGHGGDDGRGGEPDWIQNGGISGDGDAVVISGDNSGGEVAVRADSNNGNTDPAVNADDDQQTVEVNGCNQVWHNARHGDITSPGYPSPYPSNADCTIVINAPSNHHIDLTFHSFDLEEFFCVFDYVLIKDSTARDADPLVRLCGADLPDDVQSTTGVLVISFVSDAADERGGFRASFVSQAKHPSAIQW